MPTVWQTRLERCSFTHTHTSIQSKWKTTWGSSYFIMYPRYVNPLSWEYWSGNWMVWNHSRWGGVMSVKQVSEWVSESEERGWGVIFISEKARVNQMMRDGTGNSRIQNLADNFVIDGKGSFEIWQGMCGWGEERGVWCQSGSSNNNITTSLSVRPSANLCIRLYLNPVSEIF